MTKSFHRMTESDVGAIVLELNKWALGKIPEKLSWAELEKRSGYSRQALFSKSEIKAAFRVAKQAMRDKAANIPQKPDFEALTTEIKGLKKEIEEYKRKEALWKERWQRIAYHIRQQKIGVSLVDAPIPEGGTTPSQKTAAAVLRPFDKEIPTGGRV